MKCHNCGKKTSYLQEAPPIGNMRICMDCYENHADEIREKADVENVQSKSKTQIDQAELEKIILTTETYSKDFEIKERLGIISSETALGMNIFRDLFAGIRDIVGGKSVSTQKILKDLKSNAFQKLKEQAYNLNANAVIAIDLDYSEFSGGGKSMLFLVATGTAVILKENPSNKNPS
jgi:uncharacterized protein YbjQ (UPF0145 family)